MGEFYCGIELLILCYLTLTAFILFFYYNLLLRDFSSSNYRYNFYKTLKGRARKGYYLGATTRCEGGILYPFNYRVVNKKGEVKGRD